MKNENMGVEDLYLAPEETKESDAVISSDTSEYKLDAMDPVTDTSDKPQKLKRIEEIPEQRGNNVKVFRMNDGSEQAVFSSSAIHVFDNETHTFEDVENSLTEDDDGRHFTCGKNRFVAKFSSEEDNDDIFSIEQGMHKVTVSARKNKKNKNNGVKPHLHKNLKEGTGATDILTFADITPDTDYEYSVEGSGVKENIVVRKPAATYRYPFTLRCDNVTVQFDERAKRIAFISNETGDEVFFIPAPFMTDANGITSTAVNFEVKPSDNGTVLLTVTADADWLNSAKRAFPVAIDPQIRLSGSANMSTYSWDNGSLFNASLHTIGTVATDTTYAAPCESDCTGSTANSMKTAIAIALNSWKSGTIGCSGDEVWYKFVANSATAHLNGGAGKYTIYTQGALDTMGYLYDTNGNLIASNDDCNGLNFSITATLTYGATYYLKVKAWSSNTGSYNVIVAASADSIGSCATCFNASRMYMSFAMPTLPRNPRIKKAELQVFQHASVSEYGTYPLFGLYQVTDEICTGACTPIHDVNLIDYARMRMGHCEDGEVISYTFDITTLVDQINKNESYHPQLVLKLLDESITSQNNITLYGSAYGGDYAPKIVITYESSYGVNTSYRAHTHELGRFGQGSVDLQCGNLMFESEDFAWSGNRMPVTIKHFFNSALAGYSYTNNGAIKLTTAGFSAMKLGYGFKLNMMQSMVAASFTHNGSSYSGYVYIGENGEETYFKKSDTQVCCDSNSQCYNLYEDVNGGEMLYDPVRLTLKQGEETYRFDTSGRLIEITDAAGNRMRITYTSDRITSVTDGAGREFGFAYNATGQLTSIVAPDLTAISYTYTNNLLTSISYPDGKKAVITYSASKPTSVTLLDAAGAQVYKVVYSFNGNRLSCVTEYGSDNSVGAQSTYTYSVASAKTFVTTTEPKDADEGETENNVITTTYTFDDDGNIVSEYVYSTDTGKVGGDGKESGINPHSGDGGAGIVSNINNLLTGHNFESLTDWSEMPGNCGDLYISNYTYEPYAKFGKKVLRMQSNKADCNDNGVYQVTNTLSKGRYTFSAYLRVLSAFSGTDAGAFIRVTDTSGNVLGVSEHLTKYDSEYTRLIVPFELDTAQCVQVQIVVNGKGTIFADAAQLENNPYANAYNMLENGNFERGTSGWTCSGGVYSTTDTCFNMSQSLYMIGAVLSDRYAYQTPAVRTTRSTRETFTLSGWAKGYGLPNHDRVDVTNAPRFRLRAVIKYYDTAYREYGTEEFTADFSPCTEEWQFASVQFSKSKYRTIQYIRVYCDYGYNSGTVYFDDIQLVRNNLETYLSASDFVVESTGTSDEGGAEAANATPTFSEAKDAFGNALTETTFTDGDFGTIYRAFKFNDDDPCCPGDDAGNNLIEETDARGNKTTYTVDGDTSRNEEVTDRLGNKTTYEYDDSGRTTKVTSKKADGTELANVSYAYDTFDNMTLIHRGDGMKYALDYNAFHNLESIGIEGKSEKLIQYTYKSGNGRLKQMTYANGHTMKAVYNSIGQMVAEKWFETKAAAASSTATPIAHYKYVYDGDGNIVRSIDISYKKEYNYEYEEGRIVRATEADITLSGEIVTAKDIVSTVKYKYDSDGNVISKLSEDKNGIITSYSYEINETEDEVVRFKVDSSTVTSHSRTDKFLRKVFDELETGTTFVSRQFNYLAGAVTSQHQTSEKLKSTATTQLVSQIVFSDERTISYKYDAEDRIIHIDDSISGVVDYTYNDLNLLESETINGETTKFVYDAYGNILEKGVVDEAGNIAEATKITYVYDNDTWKDLLTSYNGQSITYDAQGNPTSYLGHTLTWEKGRQLKRIDNNVYTYNANGVRVSKSVNGVLHSFFLEGTKIVCEKWNNNVLIPLYDNEDIVCGIVYNNVPYYFHRNLQDDIIAIVDQAGNTVARYAYDAWGACISASGESEIASINPFRYRGYYCDIETGYYYLQTRYYDPTTGRFLNSDDIKYLGTTDCSIGFNLFSYCDNNPVNRSDVNGHSWISDRFNDVKNAAKKITKAVSNTAQKVASTAKTVTPSVKNAVVNTAKKVATTVTNATKNLVTTVSGAAKDAVDWTKNKINDITKGVKKVATKAKEAVVEAWNWTTKKALPAVGNFFSETVWKKGIVGGVWETFCKDWVWETFCKDWVWETFCKDWVWETFCKKWVWQTVITGAFTKRRTIVSILNDFKYFLSPLSVSIETSNSNLRHNSQIIVNKDWFKNTNLRDKIIWDQGDRGIDDPKTTGCLHCGAKLDLGKNGCGYISIYNSGILLNKYMDLRSIIYWMEQNDGLLLKSAFGTNPLVMKHFFDIMGISCDLYTDITTFESKKVSGGIYIICQWNDKDNIFDGAHYYAVECQSGTLRSFNGYHDHSGTNTFAEQLCWTDRNGKNYTGGLICGMYLH